MDWAIAAYSPRMVIAIRTPPAMKSRLVLIATSLRFWPRHNGLRPYRANPAWQLKLTPARYGNTSKQIFSYHLLESWSMTEMDFANYGRNGPSSNQDRFRTLSQSIRCVWCPVARAAAA